MPFARASSPTPPRPRAASPAASAGAADREPALRVPQPGSPLGAGALAGPPAGAGVPRRVQKFMNFLAKAREARGSARAARVAAAKKAAGAAPRQVRLPEGANEREDIRYRRGDRVTDRPDRGRSPDRQDARAPDRSRSPHRDGAAGREQPRNNQRESPERVDRRRRDDDRDGGRDRRERDGKGKGKNKKGKGKGKGGKGGK